MLLVIKYGFILFCSVYVTTCLTNSRQEVSFSRCAIRAFFLALQVFCVVCTRHYSMSVSILVMIFSSVFIERAFLKLDLTTAISATVISYGITYILYAGGVLVLVVSKFLIGDHSVHVSLFACAAIGVVQVLLSILLFRTKRLSHGLPFLRNSRHSGVGVCISIALWIVAAMFGIKAGQHHTTVILCCSILGLTVLLWYWCKNYFSREYLDQMQKREQEKLEDALDKARNENKLLRIENETLSKTIHKDNKIIPAMELAVTQLLYSVAQDDNRQSRIDQSQKILEQLKTLSEERAGIIKSYQNSIPKLPRTGLSGLDALFHFMNQKAKMDGTAFYLTLDNNIGQILIQNISEHDASTLLADLIENALIAANHCNHEKSVQVKLGLNAGIFYMSVYDSGDPFPQEVLDQWGSEQVTTHADTGGSGIGLITVYQLCQKYNASFEIKQTQNTPDYLKSVSVQFDGLGVFRVYT